MAGQSEPPGSQTRAPAPTCTCTCNCTCHLQPPPTTRSCPVPHVSARSVIRLRPCIFLSQQASKQSQRGPLARHSTATRPAHSPPLPSRSLASLCLTEPSRSGAQRRWPRGARERDTVCKKDEATDEQERRGPWQALVSFSNQAFCGGSALSSDRSLLRRDKLRAHFTQGTLHSGHSGLGWSPRYP